MPSALRCVFQGTNVATTATNVYQSPTATRTTVTKALVSNPSASAATLTLWVLPSGVGAVADRYQVLPPRAIAVDETYDIAELRSQTLEAGDSIWAESSVAASLALRISAQVVT